MITTNRCPNCDQLLKYYRREDPVTTTGFECIDTKCGFYIEISDNGEHEQSAHEIKTNIKRKLLETLNKYN